MFLAKAGEAKRKIRIKRAELRKKSEWRDGNDMRKEHRRVGVGCAGGLRDGETGCGLSEIFQF